MKLEEHDRRVLALLGTRTRSVDALADDVGVPGSDLDERLRALVDNGLVYDLGDGRYRRTESGRRVLVASPAGAEDERIDTSPEIEDVLAGFELGPDEADAVRHAFSLIRYWGAVTEAEIVDAIYSEAPAGRETPEAWWALVREPLAALPDVEAPTEADEPWRYAGPAEVEAKFTDGRRVLSRLHPVYGDVKHALESLEMSDDERAAARAAFEYLYRRGPVTEPEVRDAVYPDHPAGYSSATDWWDAVVRVAFDALPGVERTDDGKWRYRRP